MVKKNRELQILGTTPVPFKLPTDWTTEKRSRSSSAKVDTYYHEPGTGKQFRSLISVQRYLNGEADAAPRPNTVKASNENNRRIMPNTFKNHSLFNVPDGWIVQEIPRKNINYAGHIDKFYIDPGTGRRFRSLLSVQRYLEEGKEHGDSHKALRSVYQFYPPKYSGYEEERISGIKVKASVLDLSTPPAKVKWVLNGPWGNTWSAFMGDSLVPESMKQKWSNASTMILGDRS